ncbi:MULTISPECIES: hypothetical protein [Haloferax]|uniref:DUF8101 domain-containing protein n=2 Tax=Haloferax TaxID=2251 RepID=A0A6G1Z3H5_9EURY|nr:MULTISPECIES: hypothetical protein [Haloferax]KAB1188175.1 hypothetical protein Hfx1149_09085 [Haloferax sp. CBA1149]MRW80854.1 hypothetical protein [Haloferax marinisediminis]
MRDAGDLPVSVRDALVESFDEARDAVRRGDTETALERIDTAAGIVRHKVPPGLVRERLEHGVAAVERTAADEPVVASEYLHVMKRMLTGSEDV